MCKITTFGCCSAAFVERVGLATNIVSIRDEFIMDDRSESLNRNSALTPSHIMITRMSNKRRNLKGRVMVCRELIELLKFLLDCGDTCSIFVCVLIRVLAY